MTKFPYAVTELTSGLFKLSFLDFPMFSLFGRSHYVLRLEAAWALNALISIRIRKGLNIPKPVESLDSIPIEEHIDFRLRLHWGMQDKGLSINEFAKELDLSPEITANLLRGEEESDCPPYLEAIASRDVRHDTNRSVSIQVGGLPTDASAELVMLAM